MKRDLVVTTRGKTLVISVGILGVLTLLLSSFLVIQNQAWLAARKENHALRQRIDELSNLAAHAQSPETLSLERFPTELLQAPVTPTLAPIAESPSRSLDATNVRDRTSTNARERILRDYPVPPKVTYAQIEAYLKDNQRSAASLLASSRVTRDQMLLHEAIDKYPSDPQVAFAAVFKKDLSPEDRRFWLDSFKKYSPDNALANYLSAREYFKSGQSDRAVQELTAAAGKRQFQDYFVDSAQSEEDAWSAAGYSVAEAKIFSSWSLLYPQLGELQTLGQDMVSLADSYRQAGDESSAQAALQMVVNLAQRLDGSPAQPLPSRSVRLEIESMALRAMDPNSQYGGAGQTVSDRLNELAQQQAWVNELEVRADKFELRQKVSEQDWINYKDRWRALGEEAALQWLVTKYGQK